MRISNLSAPPQPYPSYVGARVVILIVVLAVVIVFTLRGYSIEAAAAAIALCGGTAADLALRLGLPTSERRR